MPLLTFGGLFESLTLYELYVLSLRVLIAGAIAASLVVTAARLLTLFKFCFYTAKAAAWKHPQQAYSYVELPQDAAAQADRFPVVAVQLPMFNERFVAEGVIDAAVRLQWPRQKLHIQVLDDSTDVATATIVDRRVAHWKAQGVNITRVRRTNRRGFKAGALKEGMQHLSGCEYVAIFDADFKPAADFLMRTVPYLTANATVGFVQACWAFVNPGETLLTKAQQISLNYHFQCEQFAYFASGAFWNFNGTAGVWRKACIEDVGGWNARTTVEDMDLSLRAYLQGWHAVFLRDVPCLNELPASLFAYRKQQHRWTCGPVALWRKTSGAIFQAAIPWHRKLEIFLIVFGVQKFLCHWVNFGFYCVLVPLSVFTPEVRLPLWALVHVPAVVTITTTFFTRSGWIYALLYVLFENAMGIVKLGAVVAGLLNSKRAQEWVVTTKLGSNGGRRDSRDVVTCKMYAAETAMAFFLWAAAAQSILVRRWTFAVFLVVQGAAFFAFGLNLVDCNAPAWPLGWNSKPAPRTKDKGLGKERVPLSSRENVLDAPKC